MSELLIVIAIIAIPAGMAAGLAGDMPRGWIQNSETKACCFSPIPRPLPNY